MSKLTSLKPLVAGMGAAVVASTLAVSTASAADNPFATTELSGGFMQLAEVAEGKCGEGKCGGAAEAKSASEGKCGEGKCGGAAEAKSASEGKCGEGKCGGSAAKSASEGKCGEGKCGS